MGQVYTMDDYRHDDRLDAASFDPNHPRFDHSEDVRARYSAGFDLLVRQPLRRLALVPRWCVRAVRSLFSYGI